MQTSVGAPGRTRTCNPRLRRPMLYPVELQAQNSVRANIPRPDSHSGCRANPVRPAARRVSAGFVTPSIMATPAQLVGVAGFEPATYCSQSSCATRLRYTPASHVVSPILHAGVNAILRSIASSSDNPRTQRINTTPFRLPWRRPQRLSRARVRTISRAHDFDHPHCRWPKNLTGQPAEER